MLCFENYLRYFHTIRYLRLRQIGCRAGFLIRRRWWDFRRRAAPRVAGRRVGFFSPLYAGLNEQLKGNVRNEAYEAAIDGATAVSEGRFRFLGQELDYKNGVNWHDGSVSQLWRYHLHYFDYVEDLMVWAAAGECGSAWETFRRLASSWISHKDLRDTMGPFWPIVWKSGFG